MKLLPFNRSTRKRLLRTRWVVHLFSGDEDGTCLASAESDDVTIVRFDLRASRALDVRTCTPAVKALMWAAARGQIEGILGGPPRGTESGSMLYRRMLLLWLVAHTGATANSLCSPLHDGGTLVAPGVDELYLVEINSRMSFVIYATMRWPRTMGCYSWPAPCRSPMGSTSPRGTFQG